MRAVAFTAAGAALCRKLCAELEPNLVGYAPDRYSQGLSPMVTSIADWAGEGFKLGENLVFIGAIGIAVRAIAPHVRSKATDVAVVAVDEKGEYAIPLLSGHIGGANALASRIAKALGGKAIVTTATDINGLFAIDDWGARNGCFIPDTSRIKHFSASLLDGGAVGIASDFAIEREKLPHGLWLCEGSESYGLRVGAAITHDLTKMPFEHTLHLMPRTLCAGVGCRKGASLEQIEDALLGALDGLSAHIGALKGVYTIELKANEPGLLALCAKYGLKLWAYSAEALREVNGASQEGASEFVLQTVGVDNVCERAALCGAGEGGELILPKLAASGVTIAIARQRWRAVF